MHRRHDEGWPEHPGQSFWFPLAAFDGLSGELAAVLGGDPTNAWIRAVGDADARPADPRLEVVWIADGYLNVAVVAGSGALSRVVRRRTLPLEDLIQHGGVDDDGLE